MPKNDLQDVTIEDVHACLLQMVHRSPDHVRAVNPYFKIDYNAHEIQVFHTDLYAPPSVRHCGQSERELKAICDLVTAFTGKSRARTIIRKSCWISVVVPAEHFTAVVTALHLEYPGGEGLEAHTRRMSSSH